VRSIGRPRTSARLLRTCVSPRRRARCRRTVRLHEPHAQTNLDVVQGGRRRVCCTRAQTAGGGTARRPRPMSERARRVQRCARRFRADRAANRRPAILRVRGAGGEARRRTDAGGAVVCARDRARSELPCGTARARTSEGRAVVRPDDVAAAICASGASACCFWLLARRGAARRERILRTAPAWSALVAAAATGGASAAGSPYAAVLVAAAPAAAICAATDWEAGLIFDDVTA